MLASTDYEHYCSFVGKALSSVFFRVTRFYSQILAIFLDQMAIVFGYYFKRILVVPDISEHFGDILGLLAVFDNS